MRHLFMDGTNFFMRGISASTSLDLNGNPIGGLTSVINALKRICELTKPNSVVVVFDGEGGSLKRREIYKEYKNQRKPMKVKTNYLDPKDAEQNLHFQFNKLLELLECLPVHIIRLKNVEADDVIGYLSSHFPDDQRVIASGDKDFYQLLNDKTIIYCPSKKTLKTKLDCIEEFGVHPNNFAVAKALVGDKSDNIKGVPGLGFKTLTKLFPILKNSQPTDLAQLFNLCTEKVNTAPKFQAILNNRDLIMVNLRLVQLQDTIMGIQNIERIKNVLDQRKSFNSTSLRMRILENRFPSFGQSFFDTFQSIYCSVSFPT